MKTNFTTLDEQYKDMLQELGNIGSGNAVSALSQMLGDRLELSMPQCKVVANTNLDTLLQDKRSLYVGVVLSIEGDLQCVIALLLNEEFAVMALERLVGETIDSVEQLTEMQRSAICEIGNIMCNSYVTALAGLLGMPATVSVPSMIVDTGERILNLFVKNYLGADSELLFVKNNFYCQDQSLESHILLHPDVKTVQDILQHLS